MTKREALRIVRKLIPLYEQGDSDNTLAFWLVEFVRDLDEAKARKQAKKEAK